MNTIGERRGALGIVAAVISLVLLAAGCSDGESGTTTDGAGSSPLADFLGQPDFVSDPEGAQAEFAEQERARQEIIAACMQREGFEYTPIDYTQFDSFEGDIEDYGSDEWVAEWGFGITTQRFSQQQVGPNLKGWDDSQIADEGDIFRDPNQDYIDSLGEDGAQAYYEALYGGDDFFPQIDESMSEEEQEALFDDIAFEPQGCEGEASAEDPTSRFYRDFGDEMEEMEQRFEADPRIAARRQEVSSCVADKGIEFTDVESTFERFERDLQDIDPYSNGFEPDFGVTEDEMAEMSNEELDELFADFSEPELSDEDKAVLAELQTEEIAIAIAVNECGGGFESEFEDLADIRAEYEQEFLDTYADQLEDYQAS